MIGKKYVPKFIGENEDLFSDLKFFIITKNLEEFQNCLNRLIKLSKNNVDLYDIFFVCEFESKREGLDSFYEVLMAKLKETQYDFSLPFDKKLLEPGHEEYLKDITEGFYRKRDRNIKILLVMLGLLIIYLLLNKLFGIV